MAAAAVYFVLCVLFFGAGVVYATQDEGVCKTNDPGTISNCSDAKMTQFEINWSPQNVTGNQTYDFSIIKFIAPTMHFENGSVHLTVWIPGLPDDKPLYNKTTKASCHDLKDYIPEFFFKQFCPFKGDINITTPFKNAFHYTSPAEIPIPKGSYHVKAAFYEKEDPDLIKDPQLLCLDGWLIIADVDKHAVQCSDKEAKTDGHDLLVNTVGKKDDKSFSVDNL